jgi:ribonuclease P protein subunit RPR2
MAKQKTAAKLSNRAAFSRMSYLYQAASYLANVKTGNPPAEERSTTKNDGEGLGPRNTARRLIADMRAVGLKTQVRIDPSVKQTVCKYCDTLLIEGQTCTSFVENKSKNGMKPWADVLVVKCKTCTMAKRFPVSAPRQRRRNLRQAGSGQESKECLPEREPDREKADV